MKKIRMHFTNVIIFILFGICLMALLYSTHNFYTYYNEVNASDVLLKDIKKLTKITSNNDLISVNVAELSEYYPDIAGWIKVNGTNINYPFAFSKIKDYYLDKLIDGSSNINGWIYIDNKNNINDLDQNTIFFAHGLPKSTTLFGDLDKVLTKNWYQNYENRYIYISYKLFNTKWKIFSAYHFNDKDKDYLKNEFNTKISFNTFIKKILKRSIFDFDTEVSDNDKIVTLKTCYINGGALVVHAKLIKYQSISNITGE